MNNLLSREANFNRGRDSYILANFIFTELGSLFNSYVELTLITTEANDELRSVHDRMPVILHPEDYELWLDDDVRKGSLREKLLRPYSRFGDGRLPCQRINQQPTQPGAGLELARPFGQRILRALEAALLSLAKRYDSVFNDLAVIKISLRLATYKDVPPTSSPHLARRLLSLSIL